MRWLLVDKFTKIHKGQSAKGIRSVTRSEGALTEDFPFCPVMPPSLLIEMMAQVGGVLTGATIDFSKEVVLAKISQAEFTRRICPPTILEIEAHLTEVGDAAAETKCRILESGSCVAQATIFFGLFSGIDGQQGKSIVFSDDFMQAFAIREMITESHGG